MGFGDRSFERVALMRSGCPKARIRLQTEVGGGFGRAGHGLYVHGRGWFDTAQTWQRQTFDESTENPTGFNPGSVK